MEGRRQFRDEKLEVKYKTREMHPAQRDNCIKYYLYDKYHFQVPKEEAISLVQIEVLIFVYNLEFFTQKWLLNNFPIGYQMAFKGINHLMRCGFIEKNNATDDININMKVHWLEENPRYYRYNITAKGNRLVEEYFRMFDANDYELLSTHEERKKSTIGWRKKPIKRIPPRKD